MEDWYGERRQGKRNGMEELDERWEAGKVVMEHTERMDGIHRVLGGILQRCRLRVISCE